MGAYANWFWGLPVAGECRRPARFVGRLSLDPERTLVLADFEPTAASLDPYFPRPPCVVVLPAPPEKPLPGTSYFCYRTATNPIQWDEGVEERIRGGVDTVACFLPERDLRGQTLLRLRHLGVRRILLFDRAGLRRISPLQLALRKKAASLGAALLRRAGLAAKETMTEAQCRAALEHAWPRRTVDPQIERLRIAHFVTALNSGGAERQACYAAIGQHAQGHSARVLTRLALVGADAHYLPLLRAHGISARFIGSRWDARFVDLWQRGKQLHGAFRDMPYELAGMVLDLLGELLAEPVDVLHCYVDDCNIVGAIAGCLAGTPAIVLSFRNGNPTHFPGLLRPWMLPWYRTILDRPGVRLCANAALGGRDYEDWLGLPAGSIPIIRNAFVPPPVPDASVAHAWRNEHGIPVDVPLVAGVFRLQPEKRPLYFLDCIHQLRAEVPDVRVVLAGVGELEPVVRRRIRELHLESVVTLLGQRQDVPLILAASDVLLLVSDWEGTPNILLEAQHCGCVPVATAAGGSPEAMAPGETGILVSLDDLPGTVAVLENLLRNPERRREMAAAGPAFVARQYAPAALHQANLHLYRRALS
jgi:glycosyltransferase involved in cell wall biosynthesis